jgi:Protein of unknown function (DUF2637)
MSELTPVRGGSTDPAVLSYLRGIGREDLISGDDTPDLRKLEPAPAPPPKEPRFRIPKLRGATVTAVAFAGLLLAVDAVIAAESWRGLTGFGHMIGINGRAAWGVPVTLDGVSLTAALIALRAELEDIASGAARVTLFAFTGASAAANWWHGLYASGISGALYLGSMSLAVAWVFDLILRGIRSAARRRAGRLSDPLPKFGLAHWVRYPRLTFTAWSLAIKEGHKTPRAALDAARAARDAARAAQLPSLPLDSETLAGMTARDRLAVAFGALGQADVPAALVLLKDRGAAVDQSHAYQVRRAMLAGTEA